jgi:hypothetical protein
MIMIKSGEIEIVNGEDICKMVEDHERLMDKTFTYVKSNNTLNIRVVDYPYEVDLDQINSERDLLAWVLHLAEKNWMTTTVLREFAVRVAGIKGFNIYGC